MTTVLSFFLGFSVGMIAGFIMLALMVAASEDEKSKKLDEYDELAPYALDEMNKRLIGLGETIDKLNSLNERAREMNAEAKALNAELAKEINRKH